MLFTILPRGLLKDFCKSLSFGEKQTGGFKIHSLQLVFEEVPIFEKQCQSVEEWLLCFSMSTWLLCVTCEGTESWKLLSAMYASNTWTEDHSAPQRGTERKSLSFQEAV